MSVNQSLHRTKNVKARYNRDFIITCFPVFDHPCSIFVNAHMLKQIAGLLNVKMQEMVFSLGVKQGIMLIGLIFQQILRDGLQKRRTKNNNT